MIQVEKLAIAAGNFSLEGVSFEVPRGAYAVLMGRTGSGKTTLLEALCGLRRQHSGRILIDGRDVSDTPPAERGVGYVPQDGALFPTLTVREHLGFALEVRRQPASLVGPCVAQWAERLGLEPLLDRRPRGLSGGERQKVALGRALAAQPGVLLLDEPLAALDEESWAESLDLLRRVHSETGVTVLHVTHRTTEARAVADLRLRIERGKVHRMGTDS